MNNKPSASSEFMQKITKFASSIAPGIFIIGFIIGTGSVTTMATAGSKYGMSLTWALFLSCFFTCIMVNYLIGLTEYVTLK